MKTHFALIGFAVLSFSGHFASAKTETASNVYDDDARSPVTAASAPLKWVGKLVLPTGGWCSATLVGEDLILTASHCVINESNHKLSKGKYTFYPGMIKGKSVDTSGTTRMWWGTHDSSAHRESDWAVMRLAKPLGKKYGWMPVRVLDLGQILHDNSVGIIAYSDDFKNGKTPSIETGCSFTGILNSGAITHNCDMTPGASGAAMYREDIDDQGHSLFYVVAVNVAEERNGAKHSLENVPYMDAQANVAVGASQFMPALQAILAGTSTPELDAQTSSSN